MKKFTGPRMHAGIQQCWDCRDTCQATLYNYCLAQGGHHVEQAHVRLMEDCIQICQTAADFMTRATTVLATAFVALSILLAAMASVGRSGSTVDTSLSKSAQTSGAVVTGLCPWNGTRRSR